MRLLAALTLVTLTFVSSAPAQEQPRAPSAAPAPKGDVEKSSAEWQGVITRQIQAFRAADGAGALKCAGMTFRKAFTDPAKFYEYIAKSDFEPIVKSREHSFGEFRVIESDGEQVVLQIVMITSPEQSVYKAMYQMTREADGWRVQGVSQLIPDSVVA